MKRSLLFLVLAAFFGTVLSGCGCFIQAQKGEAPPPPPKVVKEEPKKEVPPPPPPPPAPEKPKKG